MKNFNDKFAHVLIGVGVFFCVIILSACITNTAEAAQLTVAGKPLPPNATKVVKYKDGNYYALYKGRVAALTKIKNHAKTITVPKYIKINGKRYKVVAIHEVGLFERVDVKKVIIYATNRDTVEEPALFKDWRICHHKKLKVIIKNKEMRKWLNALW